MPFGNAIEKAVIAVIFQFSSATESDVSWSYIRILQFAEEPLTECKDK